MRSLFAATLLVAFGGCHEAVQHGLDERQANEVQAVLAERGFEPRKMEEAGKKPSWSIEVPGEQSTDAVRVLSELGLPRPRAEGISDVFGKGSLVPSPTEERALFQQAICGELAKTLEAVDGVVSARVHMVMPALPRPGAPAGPAKASAFLRVRPGMIERVSRMRDELRALVAGGVENLSAEQVTLVVSEVSTAVPSRPTVVPPPVSPARLVLGALGATATLMSLAMVWMVLRQRGRARTPHLGAAAIAAVPTRPVNRRSV